MSGLVTLLTDFGDVDGYVGAMRGVILRVDPCLRIEDIAHHVPMGDVAKASRVLARSAPFFPEGTVHCVVVDPGVGSERCAVALRCGGHIFVGPDNGVFTATIAALGESVEVRMIENESLMRTPVSHTFHGRDIFAPVAAALASGADFNSVGDALDALRCPNGSMFEWQGDHWTGRVIEIDTFGNLITNIPVSEVTARYRVEIASVHLDGPSPSYTAVDVGALLVSNGSNGTVEISCRDGSASGVLQIGVGHSLACFPESGGTGSPP